MAVNYCKDNIMFKQFAEVCDLNPLYTISNVCKKVSKTILTFFESRYPLNNQPVKVSVYCVS